MPKRSLKAQTLEPPNSQTHPLDMISVEINVLRTSLESIWMVQVDPCHYYCIITGILW